METKTILGILVAVSLLAVFVSVSLAGKPQTHNVGLTLKCSWYLEPANTNDLGHCEPLSCPSGFTDLGTSDIHTRWEPHVAWGYTERYCLG